MITFQNEVLGDENIDSTVIIVVIMGLGQSSIPVLLDYL